MLTIVPTPIGNLNDISGRQRDMLASAAVVVCEDTRNTKKLFDLLEIDRDGKRFMAFHDHSDDGDAVQIATIALGQDVVYVSDAGTPCVSDPGFRLVKAAYDQNVDLQALPGPCAAIVALSVSGLPSDAFSFHGFLPKKSKAKNDALLALKKNGGTHIFYETPTRMAEALEAIRTIDAEASVVIARELTKRHETLYRGPVPDVIALWKDATHKGECVLIIRFEADQTLEVRSLTERLHAEGLSPQSVKSIVAETFGVKRSLVAKVLEELKLERGG